MRHSQIIKAVLGPTNTGKTHYAVERMLAYASGMMGFPLRLLAREVYDRVVAVKGTHQVALITGEERILPEGARYFLCTAEAMPRHRAVDFVALDEVQMAADPQRGHVFTDHLLNARGRFETLLLGAETMRPLIQRLIPEAEIVVRPRFSTLSHVRPVKLSRLPRRSAVVGFSAADVYGMAELLRRQKGGAAIVMGALSPRTRNAQVAMYQSGEVDHLVATDAIGMGLNMDISHVAFGSLDKFDGRTYRGLRAAEAAQVAGRAGRYKRDGTFSTLTGDEGMDPMMVSQIEEHRFEPVKKLVWRNSRLDFRSIGGLVRSLERKAVMEGVHRQRDALDLQVLKAFHGDEAVAERASDPAAVQLLWQVCQVPDFRKISMGDHLSKLRTIFLALTGDAGVIGHDWFAGQVKRLDNCEGEIDTLATRIASIRLWTYVAQREGWLQDAAHWAHVTRGVEDKLSDALHEKLTQRFVDRRSAVLMRSLRQRGELAVSIDDETGKVSVEGLDMGTLHGFSLKGDALSVRDDARTLKGAAEKGLRAELTRRAKLFANIGIHKSTLDFSNGLAAPRLVWDGAPVAVITQSGAPFAPRARLVQGSLLEGEEAEFVRQTCQTWLDQRVEEKLEPLLKLSRELNGEVDPPENTPPLSGLVRGVAYRLLEAYGVMPRELVASDLRQLDQDARKSLRRFGVRIGATTVYMPFVLKPHATELRLMLWAMEGKRDDLPDLPTPGMVWVDVDESAPREFYEMAGFRVTGKKAVRVDMLERLADAVRPLGAKGARFEVTPEIMGLVGLSGAEFAEVMAALGYKHSVYQITRGEERRQAALAEQQAARKAPDQAEQAADAGQQAAATDAAPAPAPKTEKPEKQESETPASAASGPEDVQPQGPETGAAESGPDAASAPPVEEAPAPGAAPDGAPEPVITPQEGDDALVDRYQFQWAPKGRRAGKPGARGDGQGKGSQNREGQNRGGPGKGAQGQDNDGKGDGGKGPRRKGGKPSGKGRKPAGKPVADKPVDPDSPFAALAGLKEQLKKK
ncbi:helicase-related protein [Yunchengibacter salinarum]|uniref:helicase-related protein n=1 Tax=Yunchengibacter salinarum TaxID=3133399 RepID=UPI0035B6A760